MTESEIKATLASLRPSIRDQGAEQALLKYARSERIAPAQLERLAQVCNVTMMLDHSKQATPDERGQEVNIIDIPGLLDRYADTTPTRKAASQVCWTTPMSGHSVGNHFAPAVETSKAASQVTTQQEMTAQDILNAKAAHQHNCDTVLELKYTALATVSRACRGMAAKVAQRRDQIPNLVADVRLMSKRAAQLEKRLIDHMQGTLGLYLDVAEIEKVAAQKSFTVDHIKIAHLIDEADNAFEEMDACDQVIREMHTEFEKEAALWNKGQGGAKTTIPEADPNSVTVTHEGDEPEAGTGRQRHRRRAGDGGGAPPADADELADAEKEFDDALARLKARKNLENSVLGPDRGESSYTPAPSTERPATTAQNAADVIGGGAELGATTLATGATGVRDIVREIFNSSPDEAAAGVASGYRQIMDPDGLARQGRIGRQMLDMRQRVTLARLLNSDPVLAKQDPRAVMQIFESLRQRSPNLAADISAARPILREASQYSGIPLASMKTMQELERPPAPRP